PRATIAVPCSLLLPPLFSSLAADVEQEACLALGTVGVGDDEPDGPFPRGPEIVGRNVCERASSGGQALRDGAEFGRLASPADLDPRRAGIAGRDGPMDAPRRAGLGPHRLDPGDPRLNADRGIEIERRARIDEPRAREIVAP